MSADLLALVEAYLKRNKMSGNRFSAGVVGHPCNGGGSYSLVSDMRKGRRVGPAKEAAILAFMAGPVPPKHVADYSTELPMHPLHNCPERLKDHLEKASAKLLARMIAARQCSPALYA